MYLGDFREDDTLFFAFTTRSFTTGAPTQLAGTPALSVYKDADDTQSTTGITLAVDDDSITGWNRVTIDTSDAFYTVATDFMVVITTGTVGGVSVVGETVAHFSIENRSALRPTTPNRELNVSAGGVADADMTAISTDSTAADRFETMLDGTGGNALSLGALNIVASSGTAVTITAGSSSGTGVQVTGGSANGSAVLLIGTGGGNGLGIAAGSTGVGVQITSTDSSAVVIASTGTNRHGIQVTGSTGGSGILATGGSAGAGISVVGGSTSGKGVVITGTGSGDGLEINAGSTGVGLDIHGGGSSGDGVHIDAVSGDGIDVRGGTAGKGIAVSGGASGPGMSIDGGTSGLAISGGSTQPAIDVLGGSNAAAAVVVGAQGASKGIQISGAGSGDGLEINAGATGIGLDIRGGGTSGDGVHISATDGDGLDIVGAGAGNVDVRADITGNLTGTIDGLTASALADFFTVNSGETYASAVAGSVVAEIADNAGGSSLTVQDIVDGVYNEARASHTTAGTFGQGVASVQGNVTGSVASVSGNVGGNVAGSVGSVTGGVGGNVTGSIGSLAAQAKLDVNAEVVDALNVDTYAEPTGVPPATTTIQRKLSQVYMALRNGVVVNSNTGNKEFLDDGGSVEWTKAFTDAGGVYTENEGA